MISWTRPSLLLVNNPQWSRKEKNFGGAEHNFSMLASCSDTSLIAPQIALSINSASKLQIEWPVLNFDLIQLLKLAFPVN